MTEETGTQEHPTSSEHCLPRAAFEARSVQIPGAEAQLVPGIRTTEGVWGLGPSVETARGLRVGAEPLRPRDVDQAL